MPTIAFQEAAKVGTHLDVQFVRSILNGIDQAKGMPEKTDTEKANAFLLKCYTTASISLNVLEESSSYNFSDLCAEIVADEIHHEGENSPIMCCH